ncbi:MAG: hypothetical protein HY748_09185 [Elusimicrobia bacterium]|nr:hypothetical protein [Elusimicrobiota bacterium]
MTSAIRLELAKQRLAFWGMVAAFVVSMPLAWAGGALARINVGDAMRALMLFWTILGFPAMAVLLGASSGAGLRSEPSAGAEAPLPLSPRNRATAAFSAAVLYLAAASILVLAACAAFGYGRKELLGLFALDDPEGLRSLTVVGMLGMLYLALTSFVCAFVTRHGVAGGLLGAALGGTTVLFLGLYFVLCVMMPGHEPEPFAPRAMVILLLALTAAAWAAVMLVGRLECGRLVGWLNGGLAVLALGAGVALSSSAAKDGAERFLRRPILADSRVKDGDHENLGRALSPGARKADSRGTIAVAMEGSLFWLAPDGGRTTLLADEPVRLRDIVTKPFWWVHFDWAWDEDGSLWVLFESHRGEPKGKESYELYHGRPESKLRLHSVIPEAPRPMSVTRLGRDLVLLGRQGDEYHVAPLPRQGRRPEWRKLGTDRVEAFQQARLKQGLAVYAGPDGAIRKERGTKPVMAVVNATVVAGKNLFLVPTPRGSGTVLNVYEGSRLKRVVWASPEVMRYSLMPVVDGTWWGWRDRYALHILTKEGEFLPPVSVEPALRSLPLEGGGPEGMPRVLRVDAGKLWLLAEKNRFLAVVDIRTGRLERSWPLPEAARGWRCAWHVTAEGFFFDGRGALYFIRWDGTARKLEWKS